MTKVAIVGSTTWGTTLGIVMARKGIEAVLLARTSEEASRMQSERRHLRHLQGVSFPDGLRVSGDPEEALEAAKIAVVAVPAKDFRSNLRSIRPALRGEVVIVSATKGLEPESALRMSQVIEEEVPSPLHPLVCVLSGPNLAREIADGRPSSSVVASRSEEASREVQESLMSSTFRVYTNDDVVGVEMGGTLKNIIVIGAGICDGMKYGENGKAALITRGLAEITRLGVAAGANPATFAGLAGMGDLVATCVSPLSRNRHVGEQLALGRNIDEILASMTNVAEGVQTTAEALTMARKLGVEMPITEAIYRVLFEKLDPTKAVMELMGRPPRSEDDGSISWGAGDF